MKDFTYNFATVTMDDRTSEGIPSMMDDIIINAIRAELDNAHGNAWNFFEIAIHAMKANKRETETLLDLIREDIGNHIIGIFGVRDGRVSDSYLIIAIYNKYRDKVDLYDFSGNAEACDIIFTIPREEEEEEGDPSPSEEEMIAMYEAYVANYGEILDARYINGAV